MNPNLAAAWLRAQIIATPTLSAIGDRIFPDFAPKGTPNPCLIYQLIESGDEPILDPGAPTDQLHAFQIRIYAATRKQANQLRTDFRKTFANLEPMALPGWRLTATAYAHGEDTFDTAPTEYGATAVLEIHGEPPE
jgi:hypothetical protein